MILIIFTILYSLYLPLILKFENLRPRIYHTIKDESLKKKWMKNKIIIESLMIASMVVFSCTYWLNSYSVLNENTGMILLNIACVMIIISIIISLINNKKNAKKLGFFNNKI